MIKSQPKFVTGRLSDGDDVHKWTRYTNYQDSYGLDSYISRHFNQVNFSTNRIARRRIRCLGIQMQQDTQMTRHAEFYRLERQIVTNIGDRRPAIYLPDRKSAPYGTIKCDSMNDIKWCLGGKKQMILQFVQRLEFIPIYMTDLTKCLVNVRSKLDKEIMEI